MPRYEKSLLTDQLLDKYEAHLSEIMLTQKLYLDPKLTLDEIALRMKLPAHYVTQLLNVRLNVTFYNYVNHLRVLCACTLISHPENVGVSLIMIAEHSGFNSKVSFNRNFKQWMNCTPSEYRKRLFNKY